MGRKQRIWPIDELMTFAMLYHGCGQAVAMKAFGITQSVANYTAKSIGISVDKATTIQLRAEKMCQKTTSTKKVDDIIRSSYLNTPSKTLANKINRSDTFVRTRMRQLGLIVPREIIEQRKIDSQIKPGHVPPNKGKTWDEYMPKEAQEKSKASCFKKGHLPHNTKHDGAISLRVGQGTGRSYWYIRLALGKWRELHLHNWEKVNGKLPSGHCLWAKDGNSLNLKPENWELITRKENYRRNSASYRMSDKFVAMAIVGMNSKGVKESVDYILKNHPELIITKRTQLLLNRTIKQYGTGQKEK